MKKTLFALAFLLLPVLAEAQAAPSDRFVWTMAHPAAQAQAFRYELELDGAIAPAPLVHTCTGTTLPVECVAPIPAVTPGSHTARVRAVDTSSATPLPGDWSTLLTFTMRAVPATPGGFGIRPAGVKP